MPMSVLHGVSISCASVRVAGDVTAKTVAQDATETGSCLLPPGKPLSRCPQASRHRRKAETAETEGQTLGVLAAVMPGRAPSLTPAHAPPSPRRDGHCSCRRGPASAETLRTEWSCDRAPAAHCREPANRPLLRADSRHRCARNVPGASRSAGQPEAGPAIDGNEGGDRLHRRGVLAVTICKRAEYRRRLPYQ